jgi:chromosome segregation ATPase
MDPNHQSTSLQGSVRRPSVTQPDEVSRRPSDAAPAELDYQAAWRHTLVTVKEALADLEAAANRTPVEPMMAVSSLVERLVAVATAAADAAGQHIRAEARAEVAQTQAVVAQVQAELLRAQEQLKALSEDLDAERAARARAEAALADARDASEQASSAYESRIRSLSTEIDTHRAEVAGSRAQVEANRVELETQRAELSRLRQQIETERADRAALIAAITHAISVGEAGRDAGRVTTPLTADSARDDANADSETSALGEVAGSAPPTSDAAGQAASHNPELVAYARELLGRAETLYRADVAARKTTSELIDRLASSLRRARLAFARRMGATNLKETSIFEQQLAEVLDTSEETTFSRHLGIAAYESLSKPGL